MRFRDAHLRAVHARIARITPAPRVGLTDAPSQRGVAPERLPSPELCSALRAAMRAPFDAAAAAAGTPDAAMYEGSPDAAPLRFAIVETDRGYVFGLVTCAPAAAPGGGRVWALKPHNYCAGLPFELAQLAVNLATGALPKCSKSKHSSGLNFGCRCLQLRLVTGCQDGG
jgi:hypothetical protein